MKTLLKLYRAIRHRKLNNRMAHWALQARQHHQGVAR